jgi:hypothetical protein
MATRATYQINQTNFYCHWDGYPEGAAVRFANMIEAMTVPADEAHWKNCIADRRGGFEYAFIRGVMDAEPTEGHDAHGDTEHRYTVMVREDGNATMNHEERASWSSDTWRGTSVELSKWINAKRLSYAAMFGENAADREKLLTEFPVIVRCRIAGRHGAADRFVYATAENAAKIAEHCARYAAEFKVDNCNKAIYETQANEWRAALEG